MACHRTVLTLALSAAVLAADLIAQQPSPSSGGVPIQPLAQQVRRLETALRYLGQPFSNADLQAINEAIASTGDAAAAARLQAVLDRHALATVHISPESRVKVEQGAARPELVQDGTRLFLVKVVNEARVTAPLRVESPNMGRVYRQSTGSPRARMDLTMTHVRDRWAEFAVYTGLRCGHVFRASASST